jgi:hypothetical protein
VFIDRREAAFAIFGVVGVIVGAVALYIAIGAKNDLDDQEAAQSQIAQAIQQRLTAKDEQLRSDLAEEGKRTGEAGREASKAERTGEQAERTGEKAQRTGDAATRQAAANKRQIERLEQELNEANAEIAALKKAQKKTTQTIVRLESKSGDG